MKREESLPMELWIDPRILKPAARCILLTSSEDTGSCIFRVKYQCLASVPSAWVGSSKAASIPPTGLRRRDMPCVGLTRPTKMTLKMSQISFPTCRLKGQGAFAMVQTQQEEP